MSPPSAWQLLRIWFGLGLQSFGGGAATLYLIRQAVVERHGWITEAEFTRDWSICQVAPGINLLGVTILIGWRIAGPLGVALTLLGLLLPSVTITVILTALYSRIQGLAVVHAALRGIVPATVGISLLLVLQLVRPLLTTSRGEGRSSLLVSWLLLAGSALLVALGHAPVVVVLSGTGAVSALFQWYRRRSSVPAERRS
ncbi:MAG: chromate transporter [Herpetosiphonaceae bacterium]|nr:chromate transporter [Herpetosiphonaceae bacterium]